MWTSPKRNLKICSTNLNKYDIIEGKPSIFYCGMNKLFLALLLASTTIAPALADPAVRGWKTNDSLGCMMMRECQDDVTQINSTSDLDVAYEYSNYDSVREETDGLIEELGKMGVGVYLADEKYFPTGHAGVYYTVGNDFFLNKSYADDPITMVRTLRHEAWHAAQDAMAGTIENNSIAIIRNEEDVPREYVLATNIAYAGQPGAIPWEKEAKWAGGTPGMTLEVLRIINNTNNRPWDEISPTPLTRLWLERNGFIQ